MTPGIPSKSDVPDDAGIGSRVDGRLRRHGLVAWAVLLVVIGGFLLVMTGTVGASLVTDDAELGQPRLVAQLTDTPTAAFVAGDYAVGIVFSGGTPDALFGATDRQLPPGDART